MAEELHEKPTLSELGGARKAAILLVALGQKKATEVLKKMDAREVERVSAEIANLGAIQPEVQEIVLAEFNNLAQAHRQIARGGLDYARQLLYDALGVNRGEQIARGLLRVSGVPAFKILGEISPSEVLEFLRQEHPQTIALVLSHLLPAQAAVILSELPVEVRTEVAYRILTTERPSTEILDTIEQQIARRLSLSNDRLAAGSSAYDGIDALVRILNNATRATEKSVLQALEERNEKMAERLRQAMFIFEDVLKLDDRSIQRVLREVDFKDLALALKGASGELLDKIFRNMSERAADVLREEIEFMGPVRLRDMEIAQQKIVTTIRWLEEADEIVVARGEEEGLIV